MEIFIVFIIGLISAVLTAQVASAKGCDYSSWALAGFFFGPLALIAAAGLPDRRLRRYLRALAEKLEVPEESLGDITSDKIAEAKIDFTTSPEDSKDIKWDKMIAALDPSVASRIIKERSSIYPSMMSAIDENGKVVVQAHGRRVLGKIQWNFR
jgi:hypothetical protein